MATSSDTPRSPQDPAPATLCNNGATTVDRTDIDSILEMARQSLGISSAALALLDGHGAVREFRRSAAGRGTIYSDAGFAGRLMTGVDGGKAAEIAVDELPDAVRAVFGQVGDRLVMVPASVHGRLRGVLAVPALPGFDGEPSRAILAACAAAIAASDYASEMERLYAGDRQLADGAVGARREPTLQADGDGRLMRINKSAAVLLGIDPAEAKQPGSVDLAEKVSQTFAQMVAKVSIVPTPDGTETEFDTVDGTRIALRLTSREVVNASGERVAMWITVTDLSAVLRSRQNEAVLERLGAAVELFSRSVGQYRSHSRICRELCRLVVEEAGFPQAWVPHMDYRERTVSPVAAFGGPKELVPAALELLNHDPGSRDGWFGLLDGELPSVRRFQSDGAAVGRASMSEGYEHIGVFPLDFDPKPHLTLVVHGDSEAHRSPEAIRLLGQLATDAALAMDRLVQAQSRRDAQRERDEAYQQLTVLVSASPAAMIELAADGTVVSVNPAAIRMSGRLAEDVVGANIRDLLSVPSKGLIEGLMHSALEGENIGMREGPLWVRGGRRVWVRAAAALLRDARRDVTGLVVVALDATGERMLSRRARRQDRLLEQLTAEMVSAVDKERRDIAIGLHDSLGQTLAALKLELGLSAAQAPAAGHGERMVRVVQLVDEAIAETRSFTFELYPPLLRELGLGAALEWLAERFQTEHGGVWTFVGHDVQLDEERASVMYRVARELMRNVVRHADATEVLVTLGTRSGNVIVAVYDNGRGFAEGSAPDGLGLGLFGVSVQVGRLGGKLEIDSMSGGSTVKATIPQGLE